MIRISWDIDSKRWYHHEQNVMVVWGAADDPLPFSPSLKKDFSFTLKKNDFNKAGPIIGILTSSKKNLPFIGNIDTFIRLTRYVHEQGGLAVVFSAMDVSLSSIHGYTLSPGDSKWRRVKIPPPDFVYNRIPYHKDEASQEFQSLIAWLDNFSIRYFNHCFFSKWQTYLIMNDNPYLQRFLPETMRLSSKQQLRDFLNEHNQIMIKPCAKSKGKGIFSLEWKQDGTISYKSNNGIAYTHLDHLWSIIHNRKDLIMQPFVKRKQYHARPFDYRILVQKLEEDWHVTGYGIRCTGRSRLTTHVPSGGKLLPAETAPLDMKIIRRMSSEIGKALDRATGPIGEFSIDLGVDSENRYWIFEINSKPMVFDENDIQKKSIERWYQQILWMTGFAASDIKGPSPTHTIVKGG
ncbi:YheC/YheD family protein [Pseudalkalibacillus sp. A8]|uniref:YheC/YheD family endospore coat-associated protein n=1 Tax=Pseudalkalibacillus sp. A8 TaxID=3382641 RepID=UPI0038B43147